MEPPQQKKNKGNKQIIHNKMVYSDPNIIITTLNISELNSWLNDRDLILEF